MSDAHHHSHGHHHNQLSHKGLLISTLLNYLIAAVQVAGGIFSNSLALLSDALHNFGDATAILFAWLADKIGRRNSTYKKTFGYKRIEILTALFNSVVLIVICVFLFYEAIQRLTNPQPVKGAIMFSVAIIGLIANVVSVLLLKDDKEKNLNVKAAYLHLLGDAVSSLAVIAGGIAIYFFHIFWLDPLITGILSIYIVIHAFHIVKGTIDILMQATPSGIDIKKIENSLYEHIDVINNIHHVHVWALTEHNIHFECHADLKTDIHLSKTSDILKKMKSILHDEFQITHVTIQLEYQSCENTDTVYQKPQSQRS